MSGSKFAPVIRYGGIHLFDRSVLCYIDHLVFYTALDVYRNGYSGDASSEIVDLAGFGQNACGNNPFDIKSAYHSELIARKMILGNFHQTDADAFGCYGIVYCIDSITVKNDLSTREVHYYLVGCTCQGF